MRGLARDPLLHYDAAGKLIGQMGADLFAFPHGIHVDQEGNVWVTDPLPPDGRGAGGDVGQQVTKLSPKGEILLQLGTRKIAGDGPTSSARRPTSSSAETATSSSPTATARARPSAS